PPGSADVSALSLHDALPISIVREVRRFLTGAEAAPEVDRVLVTVAFTDIVDSTRRAAEMGDSAWRSLLERHDALVQSRAQAARRSEEHTSELQSLAYLVCRL